MTCTLMSQYVSTFPSGPGMNRSVDKKGSGVVLDVEVSQAKKLRSIRSAGDLLFCWEPAIYKTHFSPEVNAMVSLLVEWLTS
jgi:hypothetical protein